MTDIIARLESATEGSRELDAWVHAPADTAEVHVEHPRSGTYYEAIDGEGAQIWLLGESDFPAYTTSLDAALTLVPEGWGWDIMHDSVAAVRPPDSEGDDELATWGLAPHGTPALALCIAALKARGAAG